MVLLPVVKKSRAVAIEQSKDIAPTINATLVEGPSNVQPPAAPPLYTLSSLTTKRLALLYPLSSLPNTKLTHSQLQRRCDLDEEMYVSDLDSDIEEIPSVHFTLLISISVPLTMSRTMNPPTGEPGRRCVCHALSLTHHSIGTVHTEEDQ